VRKSVADFYNFTGFRADSMLEDLPANLKLQLDIVMNRSLFLKVPAFRDCSLPQICELVPRIVRQYALGGQFIVRQGQPGLGLFMIYRGVCEVSKDEDAPGALKRQTSSGQFCSVRVAEGGGEKKVMGTLGYNDFFGERSIFSGSNEEFSVQALEMVELMVLYRKELFEVLALFPQLRTIIQGHGTMREKALSRRRDMIELVARQRAHSHAAKAEKQKQRRSTQMALARRQPRGSGRLDLDGNAHGDEAAEIRSRLSEETIQLAKAWLRRSQEHLKQNPNPLFMARTRSNNSLLDDEKDSTRPAFSLGGRRTRSNSGLDDEVEQSGDKTRTISFRRGASGRGRMFTRDRVGPSIGSIKESAREDASVRDCVRQCEPEDAGGTNRAPQETVVEEAAVVEVAALSPASDPAAAAD